MPPVRIRVTRIMDFGTIVSIVGTDLETNRTITVHVDHRPFALIWNDWKALGFPQPITFDAERLTIKLDPELDEVITQGRRPRWLGSGWNGAS